MCTADGESAGGIASAGMVPGSAAEALRMAGAALDYLNSPAVAALLDGSGCGDMLISLGQIRANPLCQTRVRQDEPLNISA